MSLAPELYNPHAGQPDVTKLCVNAESVRNNQSYLTAWDVKRKMKNKWCHFPL